MTRFLVRMTALSILFALLAAVPAAAQVIPKGTDYWRTPLNGTKFKFPEKEVENLCHKQPDPSWNHEVTLRGVPAQGSDWDSAVERLVDAKFDKNGVANTRVRFQSLFLISTAPSDTPCGKVFWTARLAKGRQPITPMQITKKGPTGRGGVFSAGLALRVEMQANRYDTGTYVGSLFYDIRLPDPKGNTPWSFGQGDVFRAGMTEDNDCLPVLREKLGNFQPGSSHYYFISELIAKHDCREIK